MKPSLLQSPPHRSAFSLVEVLAAITIIGIVTFLAIPNIVRLKQDGEDNLARSRAEALNMAIASYVQAVGPNAAQSAWTTAANDTNRFALVRNYLSFAETNLATFVPDGYSVTLPATINPMQTKVQLTGPSGSVAY